MQLRPWIVSLNKGERTVVRSGLSDREPLQTCKGLLSCMRALNTLKFYFTANIEQAKALGPAPEYYTVVARGS